MHRQQAAFFGGRLQPFDVLVLVVQFYDGFLQSYSLEIGLEVGEVGRLVDV